jgi:predicted ferric reductase
MVTALPCYVRRNVSELFYYHVVFAASMVGFAFYHSGFTVVILPSLSWVFDLVIRKVCVASFFYPPKTMIRIINNSVVEITIPKIFWFNYNPGQYIQLCVPELGLFPWHSFSLSSWPEQKGPLSTSAGGGDRTSALYELAEKKEGIDFMMEGPYGSVGVDIMNDRYKMVMLVSVGIGGTLMQSICNELMFMQSTKLKKLSFIWTEGDPVTTSEVDIVRYPTFNSPHVCRASYWSGFW